MIPGSVGAETKAMEPEPMNVDCPIIDIHAHVSNPSQLAWIPDWIRMDEEAMKRDQGLTGINCSFISDSSLYPKFFFENHLLSLCQADKSLRMWASYITWSGLYPNTGDPKGYLESALKNENVVGAKVDLISGVGSRVCCEIVNKSLGEDPAVTFDIVRDGDPLFEICRAAGKPLMCHADFSSLSNRSERIIEMANRHPGVNVVLAHIGLGLNFTHFAPADHYNELLRARDATNRNVYVDTSMYSLGYSGQVEMLAQELGSDRMLFGTDSPAKSAAAWVGRIRDAEMDDEHKRNIFHRTAECLFRLNEEERKRG
jgi:hypothetical protein